MPAQYCTHPLDPDAAQDVLVTYDEGAPLAALESVIDGDGRDLMAGLSEACVRNLQLEIAVYHGRIEPYGWAQHAIDVQAAP